MAKKHPRGKTQSSKKILDQSKRTNVNHQKYCDLQANHAQDFRFYEEINTSNTAFMLLGLMVLGSCIYGASKIGSNNQINEPTPDTTPIGLKDITCGHGHNEAILLFNEKFSHPGTYITSTTQAILETAFPKETSATKEYNRNNGIVSEAEILSDVLDDHNNFSDAFKYFKERILSTPENQNVYKKFITLAQKITGEKDPFIDSSNTAIMCIRKLPNSAPRENDYDNFLEYLYKNGDKTDATTYTLFSQIFRQHYKIDIDSADVNSIRQVLLFFMQNDPKGEIANFTRKYFDFVQPQDTKEALKNIFSDNKLPKNTEDLIELAAKSHMEIVKAHGLTNGNGRLARFVMTYFLNKIDCSIIFNDDLTYNKAVIESIGQETPNPLIEHIYTKIHKLNSLGPNFNLFGRQEEIDICMLGNNSLNDCIELLESIDV